MATSYVSPGLYTRETDMSQYVSSLSGTRLGLVTAASWGPVNRPTLVTSANQLFDTFGPLTGASSYSSTVDTYPEMPGLYAAERYFRRGRIAYIVRVGSETGEDALSYATALVPGSASNHTPPAKSTIYPSAAAGVPAATASSTTGEFGTEEDKYYSIVFTWVNSTGESLASDPISVQVSTANKAITFTPPTKDDQNEASHFNVYIAPAPFATSGDATETSVKGTHEFAGTFAYTETGGNANSVTVKYLPVDRSSNCLKVDALYPGTYGNRIRLRVVPTGRTSTALPARRIIVMVAPPKGKNQNVVVAKQVEAFDGVQFQNTLTDDDGDVVDNPNYILNRVNNSLSKYITLSHIDPITDVSDDRYVEDYSEADVDEASAPVLSASDYAGKLAPGSYVVAYSTVTEVTTPGKSKTGNTYESLISVVSTSHTVSSTTGGAIEFPVELPYYEETVDGLTLNRTRINIYCGTTESGLKLVGSAPLTTVYDESEPPVPTTQVCTGLVACTADQQVAALSLTSDPHVVLKGGANGVPAQNNAAAWIGTLGDDTNSATGLQIFRSREEVAVSILAAPGIYNADVVNELIDIAEVGRGDCLAVIDPPPALNPTEVIQWHNGQSGIEDSPTVALNSSYAALFWPWCQVADSFNNVNTPTGVRGQRLYIPPSSFAIEAIAFTDLVSDPWFAPAGLNRGRIIGITGVQYKPSLGDRDVLYSSGNAINPITTFNQVGVAIWGQRTLQRTPSALDRINVRRLMIYLREQIQRSSLSFVFEQNNPMLWERFKNVIEPFLRGVQNGQGLVDFKFLMDASTNPPEIIEQNMARGLIYVKPTKTAEIIVLDFIVTNQSSSFNETVA